jgi:hypothetical protein
MIQVITDRAQYMVVPFAEILDDRRLVLAYTIVDWGDREGYRLSDPLRAAQSLRERWADDEGSNVDVQCPSTPAGSPIRRSDSNKRICQCRR